MRAVGEWIGLATYDGVPVIGRTASAAADVGTVLLVFLLGRVIYGTMVGLVAATITAATVLHIQLSHFYAVDTFLTFATTLALYLAYRAWLRGGLLSFGLLGFACGLALACKLSAALLAPIVLLAALVPPPAQEPSTDTTSRRTPLDMLGALAVCGLVALLVYRIGEPYSFLGPSFFGIVPNRQRFTDLDRWVRDQLRRDRSPVHDPVGQHAQSALRPDLDRAVGPRRRPLASPRSPASASPLAELSAGRASADTCCSSPGPSSTWATSASSTPSSCATCCRSTRRWRCWRRTSWSRRCLASPAAPGSPAAAPDARRSCA